VKIVISSELPPVGTFIRVLRQPPNERIRTVSGLSGWIAAVFPEENTILAELVEKRLTGGDDTSCQSLKPGDFAIIKAGARLRKSFLVWEEKQRRSKDPETERSLSQLRSKRSLQKFSEESQALAKAKQGKANPFLPLKGLLRTSKLEYPTYREFEAAGHAGCLRSIAHQERKRSTAEKVTLAWLNEAADRASFWSGDTRVRALVQELDLDPYIRRFDGALYCDGQTFFVTARQLRVVVIEELNHGRSILKVEDGKLDGTDQVLVTGSEEPTHFFVTTAQRRKLPAIAS
jgi:hypothetical protein